MPLEPGARLGVYEILAAIGAGGMGEVYRARDTNLDRHVALKILPELFAADAERVARFEREARVLAALNHPNIAAIYGLEKSGGVAALAMELAAGETLAARIARSRIPLDDALPIAAQIASALEAAHGKGIVHRDLKPANIVVAPDGTVKVLDFGLAKLAAAHDGDLGRSGSLADLTESPTMAYAGTMVGALLGTAAYMSPEQARGKGVDKRADIWSFGCVVFEMLTARQTFAGETLTDVVAAVVKNDPDWSALPAETPAPVKSLLRRCLQKDPARRLHDIADARIELQDVMDQPAAAMAGRPPVVRRWPRVLSPLIAAIAAALVTLVAVRRGSQDERPPDRSVFRLELNLPTDVGFYSGTAPGVALSPDEKRVAFIGVTGGERRIYLRSLDRFDSVPLKGTEQAQTFFFSPDAASIGFMTPDRTLKKLSLADGLVVTLARNTDQYSGGAWAAGGQIAFSHGGGLQRISAAGGAPGPLTTLNAAKSELFHVWPAALPGGQAFLFGTIAGTDVKTVEIEAIGGGQRHPLAAGNYPMYSPSGHLVFFREGSLLVAPFDATRLALTGPPVRAVENVAVDSNGAPLASLSAGGSLAYAPGGTGTSRLVWVSREGVEQPITDSSTRYQSPRLAPDGRRIAVHMGGNLWLHDTARNTFARVTSEETIGSGFTVWAPDGKRLAFRSRTGMRWIDVDSSGRSRAVPGSTGVEDIPNSVTPDGDTLGFTRQDGQTAGDIYVVSLKGEFPPRAIVKTSAYEGGAQFSPDGRWLAYASNESGEFQVYLRPYGGSGRFPVSTVGGSFPLWRRDGKELFYRNGNRMMAVTVSIRGAEVTLSPPRQLFEQRYTFETSTIANYDISLDGSRFLMVKDEFGAGRLNIILNWAEELKRLAPLP